MKKILRIILSVAVLGTLPAYSQSQNDRVNEAVKASSDQRQGRIEELESKIRTAKLDVERLRKELNENSYGTAVKVGKASLVIMVASMTNLVAALAGVEFAYSAHSIALHTSAVILLRVAAVALPVATLSTLGSGIAIILKQPQVDELNQQINEASMVLSNVEGHLEEIKGK